MPKSTEGTGRFSVTLPKSVIQRLESIAAKRGAKRAALIPEAVLFWLADQQLQQQRRRAS